MFYRKNVGVVERVLRTLVGLSLMAGGFVIFGNTALAWVSVFSGVIAIGTGLLGFCPACAAVGRRPLAPDEG
jgi:hypothetical protein